MVAGEVKQVEVEILDLETQRAMVVTDLMQIAVAIPLTVVTAMVDPRPMIADPVGDLIVDCLLGHRQYLVIIFLMMEGDQMDVTDTGLGLMIWIENVLSNGTDPLDPTSTPTYQATAQKAAEVRERIARGTTAEDEMIETETETGWIMMTAAGARELVVAVEARLEIAIGTECEIESRWTGTGIGIEIPTAGRSGGAFSSGCGLVVNR
jgi:hypothetical protein